MKLSILVATTFLGASLSCGLAQTETDPPLLEDEPGRNLTEKLERNEGVIEPPPVNSTIVVKPPPTGGQMPVIEPPAPPQPPQNPPKATKREGDAAGS